MNVAAQQQPPNWQELALRSQQNATTEQIVATGMLSALQSEIVQLKAELAKLQSKSDPPGENK